MNITLTLYCLLFVPFSHKLFRYSVLHESESYIFFAVLIIDEHEFRYNILFYILTYIFRNNTNKLHTSIIQVFQFYHFGLMALVGEFGGAFVAQGFNGTFGGNSYMTLSAARPS